ncbi:hypothetical protein KDA_35860 [Dictyobacter alpinus]|uniref:Uncharacterized protein n=1 Tax=Dictyobacter alpinus TaxID=2014873 RepID=A0A402B9X1_9CHLR|nr:hypothetical protein KDA_35860 [Dictyobacter alpinus]
MDASFVFFLYPTRSANQLVDIASIHLSQKHVNRLVDDSKDEERKERSEQTRDDVKDETRRISLSMYGRAKFDLLRIRVLCAT